MVSIRWNYNLNKNNQNICNPSNVSCNISQTVWFPKIGNRIASNVYLNLYQMLISIRKRFYVIWILITINISQLIANIEKGSIISWLPILKSVVLSFYIILSHIKQKNSCNILILKSTWEHLCFQILLLSHWFLIV